MVEAKPGDAQTLGRFAITVSFALRPEAFDAFLALVIENAAASLREEAGCLRFDVLRPFAPGEAAILLYEIYESRAAFETHLHTPHFLRFDEATRAMVTRKTVIEFSVVDAQP